MMHFSVNMACVRPFTAVSRATFKWRTISHSLVPDFRHGGGLSAEQGTHRALRIEVIRLAVPAMQPTVRTGDLVDEMAFLAQEPR
jgi:hypothetical protein